MLVCIVFLIGAGVIEGFVSPDESFPLATRAVIGVCYMFLFVSVLTGAAWRATHDGLRLFTPGAAP
jgi:hypothetical protein